MTVPTVCHLLSSNGQLIGIQARGLSAPDEAAFKAALVAEYQRLIQDEFLNHIRHPSVLLSLQSELAALQSLTTAQLAALPSRGH